jgi:hypothetical protein
LRRGAEAPLYALLKSALVDLPYASLVGFVPLSPHLLATIAVVTLASVAATELGKR